MKAFALSCILCCLSAIACEPSGDEPVTPVPKSWGNPFYQVDAVYHDKSVHFYAQSDPDGQLRHSFDPVPADKLPFKFYEHSFQNFPEILISSPYPIRPNWFRATKPNCLDPGDTPAGIEFSIVATRERDYLLVARLDSTYWECLLISEQPLSFSFQILEVTPRIPASFTLHGFYSMEEEQVHLKARKDAAGIWYHTANYQVLSSIDINFEISKHLQLGESQALLRISSTMLLTPQSLWIGLPDDCLDQADWEVHTNRNANRFLLDVVVPDCYLDCLNDLANGFEFEVEFYQ